MSGYEIAISLAVRHPDIDPTRITHALGLQPGHAWRKGEKRMDEAGTVTSGTHHESYWHCEIAPRPGFTGESAALEGELSRVLRLLSRSSAFLQNLQSTGGAADLQITIFAHSDVRIDLPPEATALLGRLAISMRIEFKLHQAQAIAAA